MYFVSVFIAAFLFVSCGSDKGSEEGITPAAGNEEIAATEETPPATETTPVKEETPAAEAAPPAAPPAVVEKVVKIDVVRINLDVTCALVLDKCYGGISTIVTGDQTDQTVVVSISDVAAPEKCDEKSITNFSWFEDWKFGTKYFVRACLFDAVENTYSPGITTDYTTEPAE